MRQKYFNSKAEIWDEKIAEKDLSRLENMAGRLSLESGANVLDVGTGTGVFIPFLLKKIGSHGKLVCLDFAEEMLEKAKAKNFHGNIDYVCADIASTGFVDSIFDAVVCYSSFPHFQDKPMALKEISRILKDNGNLFICHTSSRAFINELHHKIELLTKDTLPENDELENMLLGEGFTDIIIADDTQSYFVSARKRQ